MRQVKKINIKNLIPRKEKRLVNIDLPLTNNEPLLVAKKGRRWYVIIDGHHRYYKQLESGNKFVNVLIKE